MTIENGNVFSFPGNVHCFYILLGLQTRLVLTSNGRMNTMRKQRYQDSSVPNRTIHCCLRTSPYR